MFEIHLSCLFFRTLEEQTSTDTSNNVKSDVTTENNVTSELPPDNNSIDKQWLEKLNCGELSAENFKEYWKVWVPKIYELKPADDCLEWNFDEKKAREILFDPLEKFIIKGNQNLVPTSVCGKVFREGEVYYECKECDTASTVLCVDCFESSVHKNHNFSRKFSFDLNTKIICDCGNDEDWKREPRCEIHLTGVESKGDSDSSKTLPKDVGIRAKAAFEAVLKYCYDLLLLENNLDQYVSFPETNDTYCTVVFDDKVYSADQMMIFLSCSIKCSKKDAIKYVAILDKEGRVVVKCADLHRCNTLKAEIERLSSISKILRVSVEHSHVVSHKIFATKLLDWLEKFIGRCDDFRVIFSEVALNAKAFDISIVEGILDRDPELCLGARSRWQRLLISGFLPQIEDKKALAVLFIKNYDSVLKNYIHKNQLGYFSSVVSLSEKLFQAPNLSHFLISHHNALHVLMSTSIFEISKGCNSDGTFDLKKLNENCFERAQVILMNLQYLLSKKPEIWTNDLRHGFLQGLQLFLELLSRMQGMDAVIRPFGQNMDYDQKWRLAFNFQSRLRGAISLVLEWCITDQTVFVEALKLVVKELGKREIKASTNYQSVADHSAACINYDFVKEPVSFHLPLSRFWAGLFLHMQKFNSKIGDQELQVVKQLSLIELMEPVLRLQFMITQMYADLQWKQNNFSIVHQMHCSHVSFRNDMMVKDILLLQIGAAHVESNEFIIHVLNKFNLVDWAHQDYENSLLNNTEENSIRQTIKLVEEFLGKPCTIMKTKSENKNS